MLNQKPSYVSTLPEDRSFNPSGSLGVLPQPSLRIPQKSPGASPGFDRQAASPQESTQQRQRELLRRLQSAYLMAVQMKRDPWDFAIEISQFAMTDTNDLRSFIYQGLVEHRSETTRIGSPRRTFQSESDVMLSNRSCFVITPHGIRTLVRWMSLQKSAESQAGSIAARNAEQTPVWDARTRELRLGGKVVKLFRWPAQNQEAVLNAFQAQGWPARIADPLPLDPKVCAKRRLHDTIKCLNRRRTEKLIKFRGDGTGRGVKLEILPHSE
jgi:hypothetical protein